jgi:hypothetical protein
MKGRIAVFIFNLFVVLRGQIRSPANLGPGKYSPVALGVEGWLSGSTESVWPFCGRDKYVVPVGN